MPPRDREGQATPGAYIQRGESDSIPDEAWSPLLNEGTDSLLVVARLRSPNHILRLVIQRFEKSRSRGIVEVVLHAGIGEPLVRLPENLPE